MLVREGDSGWNGMVKGGERKKMGLFAVGGKLMKWVKGRG